MLSPITVPELAELHQTDLRREASVRRMAHQAKTAQPAQPGPFERIAAEVIVLLMGVGKRLTAHQVLSR